MSPTPEAATSGIDTSRVDQSIRPQDDLFRHVNGAWLSSHTMPEDRSTDGSFYELFEQSEKAVREIIEDAAAQDSKPGGNLRKIGDLYTSFMDEDTIGRRGLEPIRGDIDAVLAASDVAGFMRLVGQLDRKGYAGLYGYYVNNDAGRPDRNILYFFQSGIGLPDESYYREDSFAELRGKYVGHIGRLLALAGVEDAQDRAQAVFELERDIAAGHWDVVKCRDTQLTYNPMDRAALDSLNGFWGPWLEGAGITDAHAGTVVVSQPSFFEHVGELLTLERLEDWKSWMLWNVVRSNARFLPGPFVEENFDFQGRVLSGTPKIRERWKRGVTLVEMILGEAVGQTYVERHFPDAAKRRMEELVANLLEAYRRRIDQLSWMSEATKSKAQEKLRSFTPKIGYPDKWRDYSTLEIRPDDLIGNVRRSAEFETARQLAKLGQPVDRDEWHMYPQTVNAYYNPTMNEIVFPAAILRPPFFDLSADDAANYGAIGAVIGHEIGHGFDDQGSQFDGEGALRDWWTEEDRARFTDLTKVLVEQYNQLRPSEAPDHKVNGELTLGENIGDLGGLGIAYLAYQISLDGKEAPVMDGLTGPQRFFYSWGEAWRSQIRPEEAIRRVTTDPHSPNEFRCNQVVRNMDEFHEAFGVAEGDALWLDPGKRVRIW